MPALSPTFDKIDAMGPGSHGAITPEGDADEAQGATPDPEVDGLPVRTPTPTVTVSLPSVAEWTTTAKSRRRAPLTRPRTTRARRAHAAEVARNSVTPVPRDRARELRIQRIVGSFLNQAITEGPGRKEGFEVTGLAAFYLDSGNLEKEFNLDSEVIARLHRAIYVYSQGLISLIEDAIL